MDEGAILGCAFATLLVGAFVFMLLEARRWRQNFNKKWPTITDAEFIAACPPGTDAVIALRVRAIVAEQLGIEYMRLHPAMRFVEDLGA